MIENPPIVGFLGFGEAAFHISRGLLQAGISQVAAFDIHQDTPGRGKIIRERASTAGVPLMTSNRELLASAEIVFSTVTAGQALAAASQSATHLSTRHTYADLNSVSPSLKQSIAAVVEATGAKFVELAVMSPVPGHGHKAPMLAGGQAALAFVERLSPFGIRAEVVSSSIGVASATKMCRSIIVKGLEALITECMLGATYYGADERVLASLGETFPQIDWPGLANYMVGRVVVHGERRAREMEQVAETLRGAGVDPIMTEAVVRRMDWSVEMELLPRFEGKAPSDYRQLAAAVLGKAMGTREADECLL